MTEPARTLPAGAPPDLAQQAATSRANLVSRRVVSGTARAADFALVTLTGAACAAWTHQHDTISTLEGLSLLALGGLAALAVFELLGQYSITGFGAMLARVPRTLAGWTFTFFALSAAAFFLKAGADVSRVWLALWYFSGAAALLAARLVLAGLVRTWAADGRLTRRAVIYGSGEVTADLIRQLQTDAGSDVRIDGIFDDRGDDRATDSIGGYPRLGGLDDLVEFARKARVDLVLLALPISAERRLVGIMKHLAVLPADVKLPAQATALRFSSRTYSHLGKVAMIDLSDKPLADWGRLGKDVLDKSVALMALIVLAPVMAAVAALVKLESKGPVLFRQKRYGFNNELIEVLKFRSMYTDRCDAQANRLVTKDDPRVTRVGRVIRKTSLDELPQLFNVLFGTLSLVGPRPHAVQARAADHLYGDVVDTYYVRHKVKPGITGWAQINGWRGETDTAEKIRKRVDCDLYYIENWSLTLDLYILARTPLALLKTDNAY